jgi:hypothetical protein
MTGAMRRSALVAAVAVLAGVLLGACGGSSTTTVTASSTQAAAPTPTSTSSSTQTPTSTTTATSSSGGGGSGGQAIAVYHPSTVVKKNNFVTVITSPDSVAKVGAFYKAQLAKGGWQIRQASVNSFHATFNATRTHEGATIDVHPQGSGSGATITVHPE